jgi:hypothetical protein
MKKSIIIGQKLYSYGNQIREYTVDNIGKKYFYVKENFRIKFDIGTLRYTDKKYGHHIQLSLDKQEILDIHEKEKLLGKLQNHFQFSGKGNYETLEKLREVVKLLNL